MNKGEPSKGAGEAQKRNQSLRDEGQKAFGFLSYFFSYFPIFIFNMGSSEIEFRYYIWDHYRI